MYRVPQKAAVPAASSSFLVPAGTRFDPLLPAFSFPSPRSDPVVNPCDLVGVPDPLSDDFFYNRFTVASPVECNRCVRGSDVVTSRVSMV